MTLSAIFDAPEMNPSRWTIGRITHGYQEAARKVNSPPSPSFAKAQFGLAVDVTFMDRINGLALTVRARGRHYPSSRTLQDQRVWSHTLWNPATGTKVPGPPNDGVIIHLTVPGSGEGTFGASITPQYSDGLRSQRRDCIRQSMPCGSASMPAPGAFMAS